MNNIEDQIFSPNVEERETNKNVYRDDNHMGDFNKQKNEDTREYEANMVTSNPEFIGINFDQDYIVDARSFRSQEEYLQYIKEKDWQISNEVNSLIESGQAGNMLLKKKEEETTKIQSFNQYLSSFKWKLKHVRIHPAGECSPITVCQTIKTLPDNTIKCEISKEFVEQIKEIKKQADDVTIVVQFYDHQRKKENVADVPETAEQINKYISVCNKIIEEAGTNIQLEIGNETNVSKNTGKTFEKLQHASNVNPIQYGKFFYEVAKRIKTKSPKTRLSIAGVASFDPTYLRDVLSEINRLKKKHQINIPLVDTISFNPYRKDPESGCIEVKNGKFTINEWNYEDQLKEMEKIASEYGTHLTIGEINFSLSDKEQKTKLEKAIEITANKNIESLIYPGNNVYY